MFELLPISFTFASLAKVLLILGLHTILSCFWFSPLGFGKQRQQAMEWKEGDQRHDQALLISYVGALLNSFLLNILLIAFDIRKQQWLSAILASAILTGFYTFNGWNNLFFTKKTNFRRDRTLYFIDVGYTFLLYALISLVLVSF